MSRAGRLRGPAPPTSWGAGLLGPTPGGPADLGRRERLNLGVLRGDSPHLGVLVTRRCPRK